MEQNGRSCGVSPAVSLEFGADDALDVFEEDEVWLTLGNASENVGEEMAGVFVALSLSCGAERLARETAREDVHESVKASKWEGPQIRPNRCRVQESRFHFRDQIRTGEGFDLTKSDCAQASDDLVKSKVNAAVSSAEGEMVDSRGFGIIHMGHC
jgi:hypothetical protein